jgi:hypothetical protein
MASARFGKLHANQSGGREGLQALNPFAFNFAIKQRFKAI